MLKTTQLRQAVAAALLTLSGTVAFAVNEVEPNDRIVNLDGSLAAQRLVFTGAVEVFGAIGITQPATTPEGVPIPGAPAPIPDVDFYAFDAQEGDMLSVDIDFGMKPDDFSVRSVDTILAIFGPLPSTDWQRQNNDTDPLVPRDEGSQHIGDALIRDFRAPRAGTYVVGVSSRPREFVNGGGTTNTTVTGRAAMFPNGSYKLIISGVTPPPVLVQHINIDIKPGNDAEAYLNPKAKVTLPVAILSNRETRSSAAFDALKVDPKSLTFGRKGDEKSYLRCLKAGIDVDADGLLDLVCHFDNEYAGWKAEDIEGVLQGKTIDGKEFKGTARLKVKQRAE